MPPYACVGVVTGANKGVGFGVVRQLAIQYPQSSFNKGSFLIYLTARSEERGKSALAELLADDKLKRSQVFRRDGGLTDVEFLPLDIDDRTSIEGLARELKSRHPDGIDILVNNAGIAMDGFDNNVVQKTLHCNYYGTLAATEVFLPVMKKGGRIVNVASLSGHLGSKYSPEIKARFLNAQTPHDITRLMEDFTAAVARDSYKSDWPGAAYAVSKAGVIGMTRTIAAENRRSGSDVLINSVCPGWVVTDMTKGRGAKTLDEGATTPVLVALGDIKGATGEFWRDEKPTAWEGN